MFRLFKKLGDITRDSLTVTKVELLWRQCVDESAANNNGRRINSGGTFLWEDVVRRFYRKIEVLSASQLSSKGVEELAQRFDAYVRLFITEYGYRFCDDQKELEQVGEFIAVAVVCGLEAAMIYNAERANLVYDLLPLESVAAAGFPPAKFDAWYHKQTGRKRTPHPPPTRD